MSPSSTYRVAALQTEPVFGEVQTNLERVDSLLGSTDPLDLLVLPELFSTGYSFRDRPEALALAETWPDGPTLDALRRWSRKTGGMVVGGFPERDGDRLYNSVAVVAEGEPVLVYRKLHLFGFEPSVFDAGDLDLPVTTFRGLNVGVMICFDWMFPEAARALALRGADVIAHPSNLVLQWCQRAMRIRTLENGVFAITTNRVGIEHRAPRPSLRFTGHSVILDPMGEVLAEGSSDTPQLLDATLDAARARDKHVPSGNDRLAERRPAFYAPLARNDLRPE